MKAAAQALLLLCSRLLAIGLVLLALALCSALAGCGGGDMPEAEDDTRVTTPATPAPERRQ